MFKNLFPLLGKGLMLALIWALPVAAQQDDCKVARQMLQTLRRHHVDPPAADSTYTNRVLQEFVRHLDPHGLYLTRQSIEVLRTGFKNLEDGIQNENCTALETAVHVFSKQYRFIDSLRSELIKKPFTFADNEVLQLSLVPRANYPANKAELIKRWQKELKYLLLYEAYTEAGEGPLSLNNEAALRKKVQDRLQCRRSRLLGVEGGLKEMVGEQFLNALATAFDPHTNYLPPTAKQQFFASLATESESFGIQLKENKQGDIEIARLVPGGPAWKSNELHEGDVLLSLQSGKGKLKEFSCTRAEEADALLADVSLKQAQLSVRKKSGQTKIVVLEKEKLQVEENVVTSFIMKGSKTFGYIALPAFYTEQDGPKGKGVANDVAKEIFKLKRIGVDGIILDLRFNGGGSVMEALNLAGMFIDEGPLGIESARDQHNQLLRDLNRGTLYDGPVSLLVNGFSASASEILAQALQTYNRALIVGSATYGKATMQTVLPVSGRVQGVTEEEPFVKVTIARYYGLLGSSYQSSGVVPDVALIDGLAALGLKESAYPTALRSELINKKAVYRPKPALPAAELHRRSTKRLQADTAYIQQQERTQKLSKIIEQGYPLRLSARYFKADYSEMLNLYEETVTTSGHTLSLFELSNLPGTENLLVLNAEQKKLNERLIDDLKKDAWLTETYRVMLDLVELQTKKQ